MDLTKRSGEPILEAHFPFFRQITDYSMISTATENPIGIDWSWLLNHLAILRLSLRMKWKYLIKKKNLPLEG